MSGPGAGAFGAVDAGAVPAVAVFEVADWAFASGSPFHGAAKRWSMFLGASGLRWSALAGNHHVGDAEVDQLAVDLGFAVAAVGGDGARCAFGPLCHPRYRRGKLRRVGRITLLHSVIQDDAVVVVDDLGVVSELDRPSEPSLGDRASVGIVQADPPGRPRRG